MHIAALEAPEMTIHLSQTTQITGGYSVQVAALK